jgi:glycosyltransferase involved in cell wall biosynthesis
VRVAILGIKRVPALMGADRTVESLLERLPAEHEYTVYVVRDRVRPSHPAPNVRFVRIPALKGKHLGAGSYFALAAAHATVFGRYDVAHVHNSDFGVFCIPLRLCRRTRIIGTFHGDPYARGKWGPAAKLFLRASEWCFVRAADALTSVTPVKSVAGRHVQFIPNGIDPFVHRHAGADVAPSLGLERGEYVMFACARLDPTKGLHHLLTAYRGVPGTRKLLVVGDFSHDRAYSRQIEAAAALDDRVVLHKQLLPRQELLETINGAAVFVFPSEVEGMSMLLLEAASVGATVVCSDIAENRAIVGVDYTLQFRSADPLALREVLRAALDSDNADQVAPALRERVLERFRWDAIAADYSPLYRAA